MKNRKGLNFQRKLFVFIGLFLLVLFTILSIFIGIYVYRSSKKNMNNLFMETVESCTNEIDQMIRNMDSLSVQLLANRTIQDIFTKVDASEEGTNYFENHLYDRQALEVECSSINIIDNSVDAIYMYNSPKAFFSYNTERFDKRQVFEFFESDRFEEYMDYKGKYYKIIGPHMDYWIGDSMTEVISLVRPLIATYSSHKQIGTLEVQYRYSHLKKLCEKNQTNNIQVLIVDNNNGTYVYPLEQNDGLDMVLEQKLETNAVQTIKGDADHKYAVYKHDLEMCNWSVIGIQDYNEYMSSTKMILCLAAVLCIGFSVLTLLGVFMVTERITRPIREFRESLADITLENVDISKKYKGNDEIRLLQERFQQVLLALQHSAQQITLSQSAEYQAKIDALQAKINPHFLYNSLMTISAAGQERDAVKVQNMCSKLSDIFRYASSGGKETSLQKEMENIESYLQFMKFRYMEDLQFKIERCNAAEEILVPKLILQPIIENCFQHGFREVMPPFSIEVRCCVEYENWYVEIVDNGGGFHRERLENIEELLLEIDAVFSDKGYGKNLDTKNMALLNVYARLKVRYGDRMIFSIENQEKKGALVRIGGQILKN